MDLTDGLSKSAEAYEEIKEQDKLIEENSFLINIFI